MMPRTTKQKRSPPAPKPARPTAHLRLSLRASTMLCSQLPSPSAMRALVRRSGVSRSVHEPQKCPRLCPVCFRTLTSSPCRRRRSCAPLSAAFLVVPRACPGSLAKESLLSLLGTRQHPLSVTLLRPLPATAVKVRARIQINTCTAATRQASHLCPCPQLPATHNGTVGCKGLPWTAVCLFALVLSFPEAACAAQSGDAFTWTVRLRCARQHLETALTRRRREKT